MGTRVFIWLFGELVLFGLHLSLARIQPDVRPGLNRRGRISSNLFEHHLISVKV